MSRRDDSIAEDIVMVASKFPWWVCLIFAFISWAILRAIAGIEVVQPTEMGTMGDFAVKKMWIMLAMFGQIVLPVLFSLAGLVSALGETKKKDDWTIFIKMIIAFALLAILIITLSKSAMKQHEAEVSDKINFKKPAKKIEALEKTDEIYKWKDKNGKVHYTNLRGNFQQKGSEEKKEGSSR